MSRRELSRRANLLCLVTGAAALVSGLVILLSFHVGGHAASHPPVLGLGREDWLWLHRLVAALFVATLACHLWLHPRQLPRLVMPPLTRGNGHGPGPRLWQPLLLWLTAITSVAAFTAWLAPSTGGTMAGEARHHWVDLHILTSLPLLPALVLHTARRWRALFPRQRAAASPEPRARLGWHNPLARHTDTPYVHLRTRACQACWNCVAACPSRVVGRVNLPIHKHAHLSRSSDCRGCGRCVSACPTGALSRHTLSGLS
ncbi:MAG TPA: DUF4405 domain-containing protein [Armatimonadota bacterium]|jgi:2-oxoglutarate ferredoxin oxidoreductase subunit delta